MIIVQLLHRFARVEVPTVRRGCMRQVTVCLILSLSVLAAGATLAVPQAHADFGFAPNSFLVSATNGEGQPASQAGGHPDFTTSFEVNTVINRRGEEIPDGHLKNVQVSLPAGFVGNQTVVPSCPWEAFARQRCPTVSQVGVVINEESFAPIFGRALNMLPLYRMPASRGQTAQFAFKFAEGTVLISVKPRAAAESGLRSTYPLVATIHEIPNGINLYATSVTFWGTPADPIHDPYRSNEGVAPVCTEDRNPATCVGGVGSSSPLLPFFRATTSCGAPSTTAIRMDSWEEPERWVESESTLPIATGCAHVPFAPTLTLTPETQSADSPSGLKVDLEVPQQGLQNPSGLGTADLKAVDVSLPKGMVVNPSSAGGLEGCSQDQAAISTEAAATCPAGSKIGSAKIETPLLDHPLSGGVYVARQGENEFGSLLALYIAVNDPETGVVIKLPGRIEADAQNGQITVSFDNNPQLPFSNLELLLKSGPHASLTTPPMCGSYQTVARLTPWSGTPPVTSTSSFQITSGPNGGPCPNGGFNPKLEAGTTNPIAGKYSPFVLNLSREDGTQQLSTITAALPKGLLGKLAGVPYCADAALAGIPTAEGTGAAQLANPSCPAASQLGTVSVGAGAGPSPFYVNTGKVYLAGPYKGAPLSLAIVTPALAGPFDLGNVVVRSALQVNPETTQVTAVTDPLPTILHGIPLDLRSVAVNISREGFTLNPTSCEQMAVTSTITGTGGASASPQSRFQVADCEALGFKPKLAISLKGGTTRAKDPALKAVLTAPAGEANIGKVQVVLPKSVFIDQSHVVNPCTRVQFNEGAGNGSACPAKSILGTATAYSPLLEKPLTGRVYFRSNGGERKLPDLVASLDGQIHVNLVGFIDSVKRKGSQTSRVRNTFASVPDAPVSRFVLELQGGKKGLLQNSTNLCRTTNKATVKMTGQNGKTHAFSPVVKPICGKAKQPRQGKGKRHK